MKCTDLHLGLCRGTSGLHKGPWNLQDRRKIRCLLVSNNHKGGVSALIMLTGGFLTTRLRQPRLVILQVFL